jgi:hypothetical protein
MTELDERYGKEKGDTIWRYAEHVLQKLETADPNADRPSKSFVFPAVAIYRAARRPGAHLEKHG